MFGLTKLPARGGAIEFWSNPKHFQGKRRPFRCDIESSSLLCGPQCEVDLLVKRLGAEVTMTVEGPFCEPQQEYHYLKKSYTLGGGWIGDASSEDAAGGNC